MDFEYFIYMEYYIYICMYFIRIMHIYTYIYTGISLQDTGTGYTCMHTVIILVFQYTRYRIGGNFPRSSHNK